MEVDVLRQLSQEIRKDRETAGKVISSMRFSVFLLLGGAH